MHSKLIFREHDHRIHLEAFLVNAWSTRESRSGNVEIRRATTDGALFVQMSGPFQRLIF